MQLEDVAPQESRFKDLTQEELEEVENEVRNFLKSVAGYVFCASDNKRGSKIAQKSQKNRNRKDIYDILFFNISLDQSDCTVLEKIRRYILFFSNILTYAKVRFSLFLFDAFL